MQRFDETTATAQEIANEIERCHARRIELLNYAEATTAAEAKANYHRRARAHMLERRAERLQAIFDGRLQAIGEGLKKVTREYYAHISRLQ
jgi:hypothetical protein